MKKWKTSFWEPALISWGPRGSFWFLCRLRDWWFRQIYSSTISWVKSWGWFDENHCVWSFSAVLESFYRAKGIDNLIKSYSLIKGINLVILRVEGRDYNFLELTSNRHFINWNSDYNEDNSGMNFVDGAMCFVFSEHILMTNRGRTLIEESRCRQADLL